MPLADDPRGVASCFQKIGRRDFIGVNPDAIFVVDDFGATSAMRVRTRHERQTRWRAALMHIEVGELHALGRHPVEDRRLRIPGTVEPHVAVAHVVDEQDDEVGFVGGFVGGCVGRFAGSRRRGRRDIQSRRRGTMADSANGGTPLLGLFDGDDDHSGSLRSGIGRLSNEGGSWSIEASGFSKPGESSFSQNHYALYLTGEGGYDGLSAMLTHRSLPSSPPGCYARSRRQARRRARPGR